MNEQFAISLATLNGDPVGLYLLGVMNGLYAAAASKRDAQENEPKTPTTDAK